MKETIITIRETFSQLAFGKESLVKQEVSIEISASENIDLRRGEDILNAVKHVLEQYKKQDAAQSSL